MFAKGRAARTTSTVIKYADWIIDLGPQSSSRPEHAAK